MVLDIDEPTQYSFKNPCYQSLRTRPKFHKKNLKRLKFEFLHLLDFAKKHKYQRL